MPGLIQANQSVFRHARKPVIPSWRSRSSVPLVRSTTKLRVTNSITLVFTFHRFHRVQSLVACSQVS